MKKTIWTGPFSDELRWWKSLTTRQRIYTVYFLISFTLLLGMAEGNPLWVVMLAVLNFGNSARLLRRVPTDKLEEEIDK